jgi:hypothetical protein
MTISLASGSNAPPIDFRIPNTQLVNPDLVIDSDSQVVFNNSVAELLVNPLVSGNANDIMKLGRPFFSSAYLLVDYDSLTFTIWKANQTKDVNIIPMINKEIGSKCSAAAATGISSSNSTLSVHKSGPSKGIIAMSVIVSLLGLLAIVGVVWFLMKRFVLGKKTRRDVEAEMMRDSLGSESIQAKKEDIFYAELPNGLASPRIVEAPTESQRSPYELEGSSYSRF